MCEKNSATTWHLGKAMRSAHSDTHTHTHFEEGKTVNKAGKHDSDNKHTTFIQIYIYTLSGSRALKTESTPLITHNMDLKHFIN